MQPGWSETRSEAPAKRLSCRRLVVFVLPTTFRRLPKYTIGHREKGRSVLLGGYQDQRLVFARSADPAPDGIPVRYFFITWACSRSCSWPHVGERSSVWRLGEIATILLIQWTACSAPGCSPDLGGSHIKASADIYIWIADIVAAYFLPTRSAICWSDRGRDGHGRIAGPGPVDLLKMHPPTHDHTRFLASTT
jgi:hypothetical protein